MIFFIRLRFAQVSPVALQCSRRVVVPALQATLVRASCLRGHQVHAASLRSPLSAGVRAGRLATLVVPTQMRVRQ
jgi:hypothetical protein